MQSVGSAISLDMNSSFAKEKFKNKKQMPKLSIKMKKNRFLWQHVFQPGALQNVGWLIVVAQTTWHNYLYKLQDRTIFKDLKPTRITKVWIGKDNYIPTKGKGTIAFIIKLGTKTISNVLYKPFINQDLLSVG